MKSLWGAGMSQPPASGQWAFRLVGFQTSGLSGPWAFRPVGHAQDTANGGLCDEKTGDRGTRVGEPGNGLAIESRGYRMAGHPARIQPRPEVRERRRARWGGIVAESWRRQKQTTPETSTSGVAGEDAGGFRPLRRTVSGLAVRAVRAGGAVRSTGAAAAAGTA